MLQFQISALNAVFSTFSVSVGPVNDPHRYMCSGLHAIGSATGPYGALQMCSCALLGSGSGGNYYVFLSQFG
jgi:hypothetical protein